MEKEKLNISCKCSEVTLDEFIDCMLNGNLKRLDRTGAAAEAELQQAWERLYSEYTELSGNKAHSYYFALYKTVCSMRLKLHIAQLILNDPENADISELKSLGYRGNINSIIARLKFESVELQVKEKELQKMTDKKTGTIKDDDFDEWIVSVGKYLGYQIRRKEMILSEFLAANKAMAKEHEAQNRAVKKGTAKQYSR